MNRFNKALIDRIVPRPNREIMEGLACHYLPQAEAYLDSVMRSASKGFPAGLEYVGYERCTPSEAFHELSRPKNNKRTFDLARSDLYLVKYLFRFNGNDLPPRYMQLPFVLPGGLMHLGGSLFHVSPVMTDKVISPGMNSVFVRLLRDKVNFERCLHTITANGVSETVQVVWSRLHRKPNGVNKLPATTKANTSAVHYLLAKFGFTEMFKRFVGFVPEIGEDELNESTRPISHYVIVESSGVKPKTFVGEFYESTRIRVVVPKERWNAEVQALVAGFFYVVDHFPSRIKPSYVDNISTWMVLLGNIIFSGSYGSGRLHDSIKEHYNSLDQYVDSIVVKDLKTLGHDVDDFYSLLFLIIKNFNQWIVDSQENATSLFGKTLEVLYYVLYDITSAIFKTNFRLNKLANKKKMITDKEIIETMNKQLKKGVIFGLSRANIAVTSVSYSGDNMYPKITAVVAQQQASTGATRGRKARTVIDSTKRADASFLEAGSVLFLSKSNATPAVRANMFMNLDLNTGQIQPKPKFEALRKNITQRLRENTPD